FTNSSGKTTPSDAAVTAVQTVYALQLLTGQGSDPQTAKKAVDEILAGLKEDKVTVNPRYGRFDYTWDERTQSFTMSPRKDAWIGSPDGDPGLTDALAELLSRRAIDGMPPEVELVAASHDVPGARLLDLVAVMDRLRSPGGCPWDARQTHASLLPYLLEESHEVMEAVETLPMTGNREHLREELGDLLLQVMFHARIAQEDPQAPFGIDEVAAGIVG